MKKKGNKNLLMVFMKNPVKGKVKTRLAGSVGEEEALRIYTRLLQYTEMALSGFTGADKAVFYSDFIVRGDLWNERHYQKFLQGGGSLGERMKNAFALAFGMGYDKALIIGTDCPGLKTTLLLHAFRLLHDYDTVLGPATDGGYYLLGMTQLHEELFARIPWSTERVLPETLAILAASALTCRMLPVLSDVDTEAHISELQKSGVNF